ncbi:MAG: DUF2339 domain-containing protein [Luteitalea sp.]|nr:DUF2339 domain-containing protein [Luteitalea sp.]
MELLFLLVVTTFLTAVGIALLIGVPLTLIRRYRDAAGRPVDTPGPATAPPPGPLPESTTAASPPQPTPRRPGEIEALIGTRWLLYIGIAAVVLGLAYFVRYAFAQLWLNELTRVGLAATAGVALMALGERLVGRGTAVFGQVLSGGGLVVLYLAVYAAYGYYGLIGSATAFALLLAVTALTYVLARRYESLPFAVLAVIGGFVTPFLAGGYRESAIALLTFDLVLAAGTLVIAARHNWPGLSIVAYAATIASLLGWANTAYRPSLWLLTELFLTGFAAVFTLAAVHAKQSPSPAKDGMAAVLITAPALYYIVSLGLLGGHLDALLVFLVALTLVGAMLDVRFGRSDVTLIFWIAVSVPFLVQTQSFARSEWLRAALACGAAIYVLHLLITWRDAAIQERTLTRGDNPRRWRVALIHLNGWWLFAVIYQFLGVHGPDWRAPATLGLAAVNGVIAAGLWWRVRAAALHHVGLALGLTAAAIVIWVEGHVATVALAIEGCALVWIGLAGQRRWVRGVGGLLMGVSGLRLLGNLLAGMRLPDNVLAANGTVTTPFVNTLVLTAACVVTVMYVTARLYRQWDAAEVRAARALLFVGANVLTLLALTKETGAVFARLGYSGDWLTSPHLARQGTISALWAAYAFVLVAVGLGRRYAPIRYLALVVFAVTILKVFVVDLATLSHVYKMATVLVLGVLLLVASYLYTKMPVIFSHEDERRP